MSLEIAEAQEVESNGSECPTVPATFEKAAPEETAACTGSDIGRPTDNTIGQIGRLESGRLRTPC